MRRDAANEKRTANEYTDSEVPLRRDRVAQDWRLPYR